MAGRYVLGPVIGVGSSAVVRRGRDLLGGAEVAVKLFRPGADAHDRRQQRTEIDALARLDHPGLVGLHDGGTTGGRPFVVTDLVEGPTLADRIAAGPLPPAEVRRLGAELADALAHVHARGIVHRDVKPANVLLGDGTGRARLADFGIARAVGGAAITTTGYVLGTAAYLAPEQVRGQVVGPPADVYALGLVLLEALTGRREYPGSAVESANARLHRPPDVPAGAPEELRAVLITSTAADPARRPTAAAVAAALDTSVAAAPGTALAAAPGARPARVPRRARTRLGGAAPVDPSRGGRAPRIDRARVARAARTGLARADHDRAARVDPGGRADASDRAVVSDRAVPGLAAGAAVPAGRRVRHRRPVRAGVAVPLAVSAVVGAAVAAVLTLAPTAPGTPTPPLPALVETGPQR